jgi:peptidoglycan/LPS O-acetylase OafA/YrhL
MGGPRRLDALDALRGFAALAVVCFHFFPAYAYYGQLGVELFFVISGFVILMTLENTASLSAFAIGRVARLYPAYWLSVLIAGSFVFLTQKFDSATIAVNTTMLQAFFGFKAISDPYWTLALELWFYAVMALIFAVGQLRRVDQLAFGWLVAMFCLRAIILLTGRGDGIWHNEVVQLLLMPRFGHLFIAGMMLYRLHSGNSSPLTLPVLALAVSYSLFGRSDWVHIPALVYFPACALFVLAVWGAAAGWINVIATRALVLLGLSSYSLYLLHDPLLRIFVQLGGSLGESYWPRAVFILPIAVATSFCAWLMVERPAQRRIKALLPSHARRH